MVERLSLREIERRSGIRRRSDETVGEYFGRDAFREFADETEIAAVRDAIQKRQFAPDADLNREERAAVDRFFEKLDSYAETADTPEMPPDEDSQAVETAGDTVEAAGTRTKSERPEPVSEGPSPGDQAKEWAGREPPATSSTTATEPSTTVDSDDTDPERPRPGSGTNGRRGRLETVRSRYSRLRTTALEHPRGTRAVLFALLVLLSVPVGFANATYSSAGADEPAAPEGALDTSGTNITFVAAQGTETGFGPGIFTYNDAGELIWRHNQYYRKYFDVDPIGENRVIFIAQKHRWSNESGGYPWVAAIYDWRNDTLVREFPVPPSAHDVDYMGGGTYIVANLQSSEWSHHGDFLRVAKERGWVDENRQAFSHNIYQLNLSTGEIEWEYRFEDHFSSADGPANSKDWTHLNDVDVVDNGTAILASPRNFDRVVLIDKETKELRWTLGEEDNYDVLYEQHNPVLLRLDPPTVLVADSENSRVVEYQRLENGTWARTWTFDPNDLAENDGFGTDDLSWPRDADRFPNGNTLITASAGGHVLEVTPDKEVVWSVSGIEKVYEAERLRYGDEPRGPVMTELRDVDIEVRSRDAASAGRDGPLSVFGEYYYLASWVIPAWVTPSAFYSLHLVLAVGLLWGRFEWVVRRHTDP